MKDKRTVGNTAKQAQENPALVILDALVRGGGESMLHQEAQGQRSFVGSDTLPTDIRRHGDYEAQAILEAAGVKFLGVVEGDDMFQFVEFPQGWKKVATDHSMWSDLVDDKGRKRASIFYKAAFYDRSAFISLTCRYGATFDYDRFDKEGVAVAMVTDCGKPIYTTDPIPANGKEKFDLSDETKKVAIAWLDENYPDWQNPGAYWD